MNKLISFILVSLFSVVLAQDRKEIEKERNRIRTEIENLQNLLTEVEKGKKTTAQQLLLIDRKITLRQQYIDNLGSEIEQLHRLIEEKNQVVTLLKSDLEKIRNEYARIIYYMYKHYKHENTLMYILSSEDFNQAFQRTKYLQQYREYRVKQATLIEAVQKQFMRILLSLRLRLRIRKNL